VELVPEIIAKMREVAPPGQQVLDDETVDVLRDLTQSLIAARTSAAEEHARFLSIAERGCACRRRSWPRGCKARPWWSPAEPGVSARR